MHCSDKMAVFGRSLNLWVGRMFFVVLIMFDKTNTKVIYI